MGDTIEAGNYNSKNYLTASQKRLFKKLDNFKEGHTILTSVEIQKKDYFVSAGSLSGLNDKTSKLVKLLSDALDLTKLLMNETLYSDKENTKELRESVANVAEDVKTQISTGLTGSLNSSGLRTFAFNLNSKFALTENQNAGVGIKKMLIYGIFANVYKKIIGMLKNYNPFSRSTEGKGKQGLGVMADSAPEEAYVDSVLSKTIEDKGSDHQWILNHINTSLPICCIDKLICITNDISKIHTLIGTYVSQTDKLTEVIGGSALSFFGYISFYYSDGNGNLDSARKLRPRIQKTTNGWIVKGVRYPERLNLQNEIRRSKKSLTTSENRAYEVYLIVGGKIKKAADTATTISGNMGYSTAFTKEKPAKIGTIDNNEK